MAKQTMITIETQSLLILRRGVPGVHGVRSVRPKGKMIALENTGVISNLERRALEDWLNSGELHRSRAGDGSELICVNSLLARVQNTRTL